MSEPGPHPAPDLGARIEDLFHIGIGLSILAFQKVQVHRQELKKSLRTWIS